MSSEYDQWVMEQDLVGARLVGLISPRGRPAYDSLGLVHWWRCHGSRGAQCVVSLAFWSAQMLRQLELLAYAFCAAPPPKTSREPTVAPPLGSTVTNGERSLSD